MTTQPDEFAIAGKIEGHSSIGQKILVFAFWIWALFGFLISLGNFMTMPAQVGVGTSAYVAAGILLWIGGMVMLGLGSLIATAEYDFRRPPGTA